LILVLICFISSFMARLCYVWRVNPDSFIRFYGSVSWVALPRLVVVPWLCWICCFVVLVWLWLLVLFWFWHRGFSLASVMSFFFLAWLLVVVTPILYFDELVSEQ
jgi:hypothetical protein